jgi:hypothetical protein
VTYYTDVQLFQYAGPNRVICDSRGIFCNTSIVLKSTSLSEIRFGPRELSAICVRAGRVQLWSVSVKCVLIEGREYIYVRYAHVSAYYTLNFTL